MTREDEHPHGITQSIAMVVVKPEGWRWVSHEDWWREVQDWKPNPADDDWAWALGAMDWSQFTLLSGLSKYPEDHPTPSPSARIWACRNDFNFDPHEAIRDQLEATEGFLGGLDVRSGPAPTRLGGHDGYGATYTSVMDQEQFGRYLELAEFVVVQLGEQMIVASFEIPADLGTDEDRRELMEIRASVRFTVNEDCSGAATVPESPGG